MATRQSKSPPKSLKRKKPRSPEATRLHAIHREVADEATAAAEVASLPITHTHAAGIDVGDLTHWVCVDATPDGSPGSAKLLTPITCAASSWATLALSHLTPHAD